MPTSELDIDPDLFALPPSTAFSRLSITTTPGAKPGTLTIRARGEIETLTVAALRHAVVDGLRRHQPARIELDLSAVVFFDARGVSTLLVSRQDTERLGCRLTVVDASRIVRRVLDIVGLLEWSGLPSSYVPSPRAASPSG
ncbi:STAS domain-containing protein [Nonomuraea sp. MCN248]|uniref:STAS domain-containing protein n=1 Tax=Nonomuraea corallina TaxID=2989783 RepID=A0ABT4S699_9ACTN|nr:STAS domain-containing protein [Nonomuraea corallina]MDA0632719.1 STAS domain-containing protein [Nonomuraea corallina]